MAATGMRTQPHDPAPVDLVHLARQTLGNRDLEQEVLRLFMRQSQQFLDRVKSAADGGQRRAAAHTIKGSARGIGAWQVAALAETVETDLAASTQPLEGAIDATNHFIQHLLNEN